MREKIVSSPINRDAAAPEVLLDETAFVELEPKYYGSQQNLYSYARLGWNNYQQHLSDFSGFSSSFTQKYGEDQLAFIKETEEMPNYETRTSVRETARLLLSTDNELVVELAERGKWYIQRAYPDAEMRAVKIKEAGLDNINIAKNLNWESTISLITAFARFLSDHTDILLQNDNMPVGFPALFTQAGDSFSKKWLDFTSKKNTLPSSTNRKIHRNNEIYTTLAEMCDAGKLIFGKNKAVRDQFTISILFKNVRGIEPAGLKGVITTAFPKMPIEGVLIKAIDIDPKGLNPTYEAVTDANGKYELTMPSGTYDVTVSKAGSETVRIDNKKIKIGTMSRLSVELGAASETPVAPKP